MPYGAEKPRSGMVKTPHTTSVEIFWDPPKGGFTKYTLSIDRLSDKMIMKPGSILRIPSYMSKATSQAEQMDDLVEDENKINSDNMTRPNERTMDLSHNLAEYTILGLDPGEKYKIELKTKTGNVCTRQVIDDVILTCPLPPKGNFNNTLCTND